MTERKNARERRTASNPPLTAASGGSCFKLYTPRLELNRLIWRFLGGNSDQLFELPPQPHVTLNNTRSRAPLFRVSLRCA